MSAMSLPGQTKVSTAQERFKSEFGLTLRVYDGRSFADADATIGQVRKKRGATSIDIRRNTRVGNLEERFMEDFGVKVQIAGSDDSYLCKNDLTLAAALEEDERKLGRKTARSADDEEVVSPNTDLGSADQSTADDGFLVNAGWEKREGRAICRWIAVWKELGQSALAGTLGGYSGGGSFQLEQFYARSSGERLTSLMIDMEDKVTGDDIDFFDDVPSDILSICDDAQDIVLEWNSQDEWEDAERLLLREEKSDALHSDGDLVLLEKGNSAFLREVLEKAGLTASP